MFYENDVTLVGRAVRDAELKQVGSSQVCQIRLVANKRIKKRDGEYGEKSCFIDCEAWGKRAEYAAKWIKRGSIVRVKAELEQDEWVQSDGQKRQKHKLYVFDIQVERVKADADAGGDQQGQQQQQGVGAGASAAGTGEGSELPF